MYSVMFMYICLLMFCMIHFACSSHFRGGTISWKALNDSTVEFKFKMGWTLLSGPGCTEKRIGSYVNDTFMGDKFWRCVSGCANVPVGTVYYYCTGVSELEDWEQGENTFQYTFKGNKTFTVSYTGAMWMSLDYGNPNGWVLQTTIDLRIRNDTYSTNESPITASRPLYTLQYGCYHELKIPMYDPNGDTVRCRWAREQECDSICRAVPSAELDEDTCTLKFNASQTYNYKDDGWYAVALTVEDFPKQVILIGNDTYTPRNALSTVPVQFLIHLESKTTPCNYKPNFVTPTPVEGSKISIAAGQQLKLKMFSVNERSKYRIDSISLTRPAELTANGPHEDTNRTGVVYWELSWQPTIKDAGSHIICASVADINRQESEMRCFTIIAWDSSVDPCNKVTCFGNTSCSRIGSTQNTECTCPQNTKQNGNYCTSSKLTTNVCLCYILPIKKAY